MKKIVLFIVGILILVAISCLLDAKPEKENTVFVSDNEILEVFEMAINDEISIDVDGEKYTIKLLNMVEDYSICSFKEECEYAFEIRVLLEINDKIHELGYITNPEVQLGESNKYFRFQGGYTGDKVFFNVIPLTKGDGYIVDNHVYLTKNFYERGIHYSKDIYPDLPGYYYYIAMGKQPSGGYKIVIEEVTINNNIVQITVKETKPKTGDPVTLAMTYPKCLIILDSQRDIIVKNQDGEIFENLNF